MVSLLYFSETIPDSAQKLTAGKDLRAPMQALGHQFCGRFGRSRTLEYTAPYTWVP